VTTSNLNKEKSCI